jgi:hypothetical protein
MAARERTANERRTNGERTANERRIDPRAPWRTNGERTANDQSPGPVAVLTQAGVARTLYIM